MSYTIYLEAGGLPGSFTVIPVKNLEGVHNSATPAPNTRFKSTVYDKDELRLNAGTTTPYSEGQITYQDPKRRSVLDDYVEEEEILNKEDLPHRPMATDKDGRFPNYLPFT